MTSVPFAASRRSCGSGIASGSSSHEAAVIVGRSRATIFSGSDWRRQRRRTISVRSQPRQEDAAAPGPRRLQAEARERVNDGEEARQQQHLDEHLRRGAGDLDLARSGQDARALRVLFEEAAQPDRREPVERERERLEEQERQVAEPGEAIRRSIMRRRAIPSRGGRGSRARPSRPRPSRGRIPAGAGSRGRGAGRSRGRGLAAPPGLARRIRHRHHDVAEQRRPAAAPETRARPSNGPCPR